MLSDAPTVQCFRSVHWIGVIVALIVLGLMCFTIPSLLYMLKLLREKHDFKSQQFLDKYGVLYHSYRNTFWWYLALDLGQRVLISALAVAFRYNDLHYSVALFMGIWVCCLIHYFLRPYIYESDNHAKMVLVLLLLVLALLRALNAADIGILVLPELCLLLPVPFVIWKLQSIVRSANNRRKDSNKLINVEGISLTAA